ncbi:heme-binding protein soul2 [Hoplias malabaricus]|uniref:heme-binding protein soul2 n=1 Tax=Hoplias malabaricus TaxID=27720 RepID=UPI0034636B6D
MKTSLLVALCLPFVLSFCLRAYGDPEACCPQCLCPEYVLINKHETFEERLYKSSRWITTDLPDTSRGSVMGGFWKLNEYIKNFEVSGRPVILSVRTGENGQEQVTLSYHISPDTVLPNFNDQTIKEEIRPGGTVYVRIFSSDQSEKMIKENKDMLFKDLQAAGILFDDTRYDAAAYKGIFVLEDRQDEIWSHAF